MNGNCQVRNLRNLEDRTPRAVAISEDLVGFTTFSGKPAIVSADQSNVEIKDVSDSILSKFPLPVGTFDIQLNPDRTRLVSASPTGVEIWDLNGQRLGGFQKDLGKNPSLLEGSDYNRIAVLGLDAAHNPKSAISVYDGKGALVASFEPAKDGALSPDGKLLAISGGSNNVPTIWDIETKEPVAQYPSSGDIQFAFTPDGKSVLIVGDDAPARLWRVETKDELVTEACKWIGDYLHNNPGVSAEDRQLCSR
jgi:WD40 repeat protein